MHVKCNSARGCDIGGSKGKNSAKSSNQSAFNQNIPKFQQDALTQLYSQAGGLFNQNNAQMQRAIPGAQNQANAIQNMANPAYQNQLQGGAYSNVDGAAIQKQLADSMNKPSETSTINAMIMGGSGNNYADAMKSQYMQDANRAQQMMLGNLDARAAASGMSGGDRHGVATAMGTHDINQNLQSNLAQTGFNTFDKDLERKLGIAQQADANMLERQGLMQNMLGAKQQAMQGGLQGASSMQNLGMGQFAPLSMPWTGMKNYTAAIGGPTVLSSGNSSGSSKGLGSSKSGGIGGGK